MSNSAAEKQPVTRQTAIFRFAVASLFGIFVFFVKIPINGKSALPIDWITGIVSGALVQYSLYLALIASVYVLYRLYRIKFWKGRPFEIFLNLLSVFAIFLFVCDIFGVLPQFFVDNGVYAYTLKTLGKFCLGIETIMFFLPPLILYGLPEALGIFARPLTRPLFNLPGRSAVIVVSAFMGNFTAGHLEANTLYTSGKINHREAAIIATGFCTSSVGLIISVLTAGGQMDRFTLIFFLLFAVTMAITAVTSHIYPLCKYPTTYYENMAPAPEEYEKGNIFKAAFNTGVNSCNDSISIPEQCIRFGIKSLPVVANIFVCGVGAMVAFTLLNKYTPVFSWIGMLFYPFIKLVGLQDVGIIASSLGINAVDNVTSQLTLVTAAGVAPSTILFGCGFGIVTVVFFGSFLASLYSTKIQVKFVDLLLIWAERTALTVLIWGFIARILA